MHDCDWLTTWVSGKLNTEVRKGLFWKTILMTIRVLMYRRKLNSLVSVSIYVCVYILFWFLLCPLFHATCMLHKITTVYMLTLPNLMILISCKVAWRSISLFLIQSLLAMISSLIMKSSLRQSHELLSQTVRELIHKPNSYIWTWYGNVAVTTSHESSSWLRVHD